ncbi:DUF5682 family protein [Streptomyces sp. NPDC014894]|uniref:DUF5682 family protein n=1 Tax=Streptomyces sp. NPDC014894 TaxID=3364931 RepID=UPI0037004837
MSGPLLLGVRHHGPGSARAVRAALEAAEPAAVLIEGPPEGDALLALAADERMRPPVALLAHAVDDPGRAAFWPLAEFSPEWVAIRWALARGVPVRFIDLPAAHSLAAPDEEPPGETAPPGGRAAKGRYPAGRGDGAAAAVSGPAGSAPDGAAGAALAHAPGPSAGSARGPVSGPAAGPGSEALSGPVPDAGAGCAPGAGAGRSAEGATPGGRTPGGGGAGVGPFGPGPSADVVPDAVSGVTEASGAGPRAADAGGGSADPEWDAVPGGAAAGFEEDTGFEGDAGPGGSTLGPRAGRARSEGAPLGAEKRIGARAGGGPAPGGTVVDPEWDAVPTAARGRAGADPEWDALPGTPGRSPRPASGAGPGPGAEPVSRTAGAAIGRPAGERPARDVRVDPLAALAEAAGHDDPERWWEDVVEHRGGPGGGDPLAPFAALADAMDELRAVHGHGGHERDLVREAHMRLRLRSARKEFGDRVAVVCGAWHIPALRRKTTVAADKALLKGLPKVRTEITWVPWTHRRLARHSGYGAGIDSPGWYAHLFRAPDRPVERWMTEVAGLLRAEDRIVSPAHVIEAVRLAESLAVLRGRPLPGLAETVDAVRSVMCDGSDVPLDLVRDRLIVGDVFGEVPDDAPAVPLQRDLNRSQRSLRLKPEAPERELELDLRKETDAARSRLLHRLRLLSVHWGVPVAGRGSTGTFRESWRLRWEPELHVKVAEAGVWGTTVLSAAAAVAEHRALTAADLADVTSLAEECLLAEVADALPVVMRALADRAALDTDVGHLAQALPALARSLRYGDVRATDTAALAEVAAGLAERICVGLPPACTGLDAEGADRMRGHLDAVHTAVALLPDARKPAEHWRSVLHRLAARDTVPGVIRGRSARLLLDEGRLDESEAARHMSRALSAGTPPAEAAAWIEGFVGGSSGGGMLLVHDERLLGLVDAWLTGVPADAFTDVLPLLRRTFSAYDPGVRRTLGELVRRGTAGPGGGPARPATAVVPGFGPGLHEERADAVLPVLRLLLGMDEAVDRDTGTGGRSTETEAIAPAPGTDAWGGHGSGTAHRTTAHRTGGTAHHTGGDGGGDETHGDSTGVRA